MGEVPSRLQMGVMSDVASRRRRVSDLGPCMYLFKSSNAVLKVLVVALVACKNSVSCSLVLPPPLLRNPFMDLEEDDTALPPLDASWLLRLWLAATCLTMDVPSCACCCWVVWKFALSICVKDRMVEKNTSAVVRDLARFCLVHLWNADSLDFVLLATCFVACFCIKR